MRTIEYLSAGRLTLKKSIKTMTVSFTGERTSVGLRCVVYLEKGQSILWSFSTVVAYVLLSNFRCLPC